MKQVLGIYYIICFIAVSVSFAEPPYPHSPVIQSLIWSPKESIIRLAKGSDNWPATWADDGALYTAYGDGFGFQPFVKPKLSLGFARIMGMPPDIRGENIRSESGEQIGDGRKGKKASGILMVDGTLYLWLRNAGNSQLAWSNDHAKTWTFADWTWTQSFGMPTFLNFGKNYDGARDEYVYIYSADADSAYDTADRMVLARVKKDKLRSKQDYEFFVRLGANEQPVWSANIEDRGAVFKHTGKCYRSGISYNPYIKRYIWCQIMPISEEGFEVANKGPRFEGGFGVYDAPQPWGPWTTVYFTEKWDVGPGETSRFPTKWMSQDGQRMFLLFSGDDYCSVRQASLKLAQ